MYLEQDVANLRRRVSLLERQIAFLMQAFHVTFEDEGDPVPPEVVELLRRGNKIAAIKAYREATGATLREAKALIESLG